MQIRLVQKCTDHESRKEHENVDSLSYINIVRKLKSIPTQPPAQRHIISCFTSYIYT